MASAVPLYQKPLSDVMDGVNTKRPPCFLPKSHHFDEFKCCVNDFELYCVMTPTLLIRELDMLLSTKSMLRYPPAIGSAAVARFFVSSFMRVLDPPAKINPIALITCHLPLSKFRHLLRCYPDNLQWLSYPLWQCFYRW